MHYVLPFIVLVALAWGIPSERRVWGIVMTNHLTHLFLEAFVWPAQIWVFPCVGAIEAITAAFLLRARSGISSAMGVLFLSLSLWNCIYWADYVANAKTLHGYHGSFVTVVELIIAVLASNGIYHAATRLRQSLAFSFAGGFSTRLHAHGGSGSGKQKASS